MRKDKSRGNTFMICDDLLFSCEISSSLIHYPQLFLSELIFTGIPIKGTGQARRMTLIFMRNKNVEVESLADGNLSVSWRLADTFSEIEIRITFRLPDLEMISAEGRIGRSPHPECAQALPLLQKVVGVRVGPGVRKIVQGLLGGEKGCRECAEGVLESCNAVILHFTAPQIRENEKGTEEERKKKFQAMLKFNPRLARSCVAFADDSPLREGLNL